MSVETYFEKGKQKTRRHYRAPTEADLRCEAQVLELLEERFTEWQEKGYIPSSRIEPGVKTDEPIRTRGWTHWNHLFTPRQLLILGILSSKIELLNGLPEKAGVLLALGKTADWYSRLTRWNTDAANEKTEQTFFNQALNTLFNYGSRSLYSIKTAFLADVKSTPISEMHATIISDAKAINSHMDLWITDPPYADAVSYEEVSEFFLAWYEKHIPQLFPAWYGDSSVGDNFTSSPSWRAKRTGEQIQESHESFGFPTQGIHEMLSTVPYQTDRLSTMLQDGDGLGLAEPDPQLQTEHPRQCHESEEPS